MLVTVRKVFVTFQVRQVGYLYTLCHIPIDAGLPAFSAPAAVGIVEHHFG
jgi:hypothetical protein